MKSIPPAMWDCESRYSQTLNEEIVKTLYRLKRIYRKPMTRIAEELIEKSLLLIDKVSVCYHQR